MGQMTPHPRLSRAGLELVKGFEGLRSKAARLQGGGWTIGYGHTASAREGASVTPGEAEALLLYDLDKVAHAIEPLIFTPLTRNQFNALVAFAFNVGIENFRASAVLKHVNEGALLQAAAALELWRRADFEGASLVVDGLVRRRAAEKALFLTPGEGFHPVPTPVVRPAYDLAATELEAQARGLAGAADVRVPLDSEEAVARVESREEKVWAETPAAAVEDAAGKLAERLRVLFPDSEPPPPPPQPEPVEPESAAVAEEPAPPPPPVEAEPEPPPPPSPLSPSVAEAAPPPPRVFEPEPPPHRPLSAGAITGASPRRGGASDRTRRKAREAAERRARLVLLAGVLGLLMFAGGLAAMLLGQATLLNLGVGLAGVALMVPAGLRLLGRAFGERANDG